MRSGVRHFYQFGSFRLDPDEKVLYREGQIVSLPPKVFETLRVLLENHGHVVDKNELMRQVWPDAFVEEVGLAKNVSALRKTLLSDCAGCSIETVPKRGYRFVGDVSYGVDEPVDRSASQQSSVIGQQSSVIGQQSSVIGQQSSVIGQQSSVTSRQEAGGRRQAGQQVSRSARSQVGRFAAAHWVLFSVFGIAVLILGAWAWSHFRTAGPPIESNILLSSQARDRTSLLSFDHAGTPSREAYDLYVKGRYYWREKSHDGLFKSIAYFRRAIEKDPNFALAWAGLARSYAGDLENLHNVDPAAQKAIALDGKLAEPHSTLGFIRIFRDHNWPDAQRELKLAIDLNPGSAMAHQYYSSYLAAHGRLDEAEKEIRRARDLDPELLSTTTDLAQILYFKRDYEGAIEECKKVVHRDSRFFDAHNVLYHAYTLSGKYNEAFDEYLQLIDLLAYQPPADLDEVKRIYAVKGVYGFWKEQIALFGYWGIGEDSKAYEIAESYALLAFDKREFRDRVLNYLSKACDKPINRTLVYIKVNPIFGSVRNDPRFATVLERLHLN